MVKSFVEKTIYKSINSFLSSKSVAKAALFQDKKFTNYTLSEIKGNLIKLRWNRTVNVFQLP
jgi:hypothetical protein